MSRNSTPRGESSQLTGYLYEVQFRGRMENDYAMSGHVRINGIEYQIRAYAEYVKGTSRRRFRLKLTPVKPSEGGSQ